MWRPKTAATSTQLWCKFVVRTLVNVNVKMLVSDPLSSEEKCPVVYVEQPASHHQY